MKQNAQGLYFQLFNEIGIISQLSRAFMDARLPGGLSSAHFGILNHLLRAKDGCTPLALARAFQVPKTTMTHTLSGLVSHQFIEMKPNKKDGRSKCVWITEKGQKFRDQAIVDLEPDFARIAVKLSPEKVAALVGELENVRKILDANREE